MRVVATAGHVDHGKSTLVWALTGVDPDRWAIEKQRGMTIDLGFAATTLASGAEVGFVDVPGHGRFVKNMLAGVGSADACLFVVAATEGWKEQSEEHLQILELLGVAHGVIALTKVAVAGADLAELATLEVRERVAGTFLEAAPLLSVDVPAGIGLEDLRGALDTLVAETPAAPDRARPRLWVDRSFAVKGAGTVVTGTLTGGSFSVGDEMAVQPGDTAVRIRTLESHNHRTDTTEPGRRVAANLVGVGHRDVSRGQALVRPAQWHPASRFDATLTVLGSLGHPVSRRGAYAVYVGSGEFPVALRVLGSRPIEPGERGLVRLWLRSGQGIPLTPGDRYVLREAGRFETVGGGEVLDVDPVLRASKAAPSLSVDRVVEERGWVTPEALFRLTGQAVTPTVGPWVVAPGSLADTEKSILTACQASGGDGVDLAGFDERARAVLGRGLAGVEVRSDRAYREGLAPSGELSPEALRVLAVLDAARWSPPALPLTDRGALRELERAGRAVQSGDAWFAAGAIEAAVAALTDLLVRPEGFTVAEARDRLGSSRKHVLPLLAHLDSTGFTARRGDQRVAGRRYRAVRLDPQ